MKDNTEFAEISLFFPHFMKIWILQNSPEFFHVKQRTAEIQFL